ncbi:MAG: DUF2293 domain-containing protein [Solirubrobacterales bacterium]
MVTDSAPRLDRRIARAGEEALAERRVVTAIDVLVGIGWLPARAVDRWRQGRTECLEEAAAVDADKLCAAIEGLGRWAKARGLEPSETAYVARTRDRRALRFTSGGDPEIERACRTHWVAPELSEKERGRLAKRQSRPPDLVVISPLRDWTCTDCSGTGDYLLMEDAGPLCMRCADMDHLVFLAAGDAALTRRARKASGLAAVVVRFSRSRRRYERQGILVEDAALEQAERECLADEESRARRRLRERSRRAAEDVELQAEAAREIRRLYPGCPKKQAEAIAHHTCARGSGRVGRTAAGRALDPGALALAVAAAVRHADTRYDELLMSGLDRAEARTRVRPRVERILESWRGHSATEPCER